MIRKGCIRRNSKLRAGLPTPVADMRGHGLGVPCPRPKASRTTNSAIYHVRSNDPNCAYKLKFWGMGLISPRHTTHRAAQTPLGSVPPRIQISSHFPRFELTRSVRALLGDAPIIERLMWVTIKLTDQCLHPARPSARARREVGGQAPPSRQDPAHAVPPRRGRSASARAPVRPHGAHGAPRTQLRVGRAGMALPLEWPGCRRCNDLGAVLTRNFATFPLRAGKYMCARDTHITIATAGAWRRRTCREWRVARRRRDPSTSSGPLPQVRAGRGVDMRAVNAHAHMHGFPIFDRGSIAPRPPS